jgi:hypothetical protein
MDHDGDLEFFIPHNTNTDAYIHARHHDGQLVAGWPLFIEGGWLSYTSTGDINDDGRPEIVATDKYTIDLGRAWAFDMSTRTLLPGWPFFYDGLSDGLPTVADVDGDDLQDMCFATRDGVVYAVNADGLLVSGFPKFTGSAIISGVAVGDIDGDHLFEMVCATWDGWVYAWDTSGPALPSRGDRRMRGVNARNTGIMRHDDPTGVGPETPVALRLDIAPNPMRESVEFRLPGAWRGGTIDILDVLGRRVGSVQAQDGRARWVPGAGLPEGVYLVRADHGGGVLHGRVIRLR